MPGAEPRVIITPLPLSANQWPATISTWDGHVICTGRLSVESNSPRWTAALDEIDRPGALAMLFFGEGLRDVVLERDDGRACVARITGTRVTPDGRRVYRLAGRGEARLGEDLRTIA